MPWMLITYLVIGVLLSFLGLYFCTMITGKNLLTEKKIKIPADEQFTSEIIDYIDDLTVITYATGHYYGSEIYKVRIRTRSGDIIQGYLDKRSLPVVYHIVNNRKYDILVAPYEDWPMILINLEKK